MIIKTKNLVLRDYKKEDIGHLVKNINDKNVSRYMCYVSYPYSQKEGIKWIKRCLALQRKKKKKEVNFVIEKSGCFIGSIGLKKIKGHKAEMGYWIGKKHWGRGIATEAVKMIADFGFKKLKLKRIYAYVFEKNKSSCRVLEKNGFIKEGFLRKDRMKDGKFVNVYLYAKVK